MNLEDLKYTNDHEWIRLKGDIAYVGITNFAQGELGDIVYVEIETLNQKIEHGEVFGTVEAVKTVSDLFMPISGEIIEINQKLESEPELINNDPYGEGWMVKIKYDDRSQFDQLLDLTSYEKLINYFLQIPCLIYSLGFFYFLFAYYLFS